MIPSSCSHSRKGDGCHNKLFFMKTTPCFRRRRVVFFLSKKAFWKTYALQARTTPFNK